MNIRDMASGDWGLYDSVDEYNEFFKKAVKLLISGVPAKDKQGHYESIRFNVPSAQMDIISAIWEAAPEGRFFDLREMVRNSGQSIWKHKYTSSY